jgi:hypothetical protein
VDTRIEHGQKSVFLIKIFVERIMVDSMIFNDITHLTRRVSFSVFVGTIHCGRVKIFLQDVNAKKETKKGKNISRNIYILIKYAESMQKVCSPKTLLCLTLSTYLVLQQLSLSQFRT